MFNIQAIVLKMLLNCQDKALTLLAFSKLKKHFFNDAFSSIYLAINTFYSKHGVMPTLDALILESNRNVKLSHALAVLSSTEIPDVDIIHAIYSLENEFSQRIVLELIDSNLLKDLTMLDSSEILGRINSISLELEDRISSSDKVFNANELHIFKTEQQQQLLFIPLCLNNNWDANFGGVAREDLILSGGWRGSGKSVVCSNIQVSQYKLGNIAPYYSIEMKAEEVFARNLAILAGVDALAIRNQTLTGSDLFLLAKTRAEMFHGGKDYFESLIKKNTITKMSEFYEMESELNDRFELHTPMYIIDDRTLDFPTIDSSLGNIINRHGIDKVTIGLVDYVNQIKTASNIDMYDWKEQMNSSKQLKNIARKHNIAIFSPYQTDESGKAKLSTSILDACDISMFLKGIKIEGSNKGAITFELNKVRSLPASTLHSSINWNTLQIDPSICLTDSDIEMMKSDHKETKEEKAIEKHNKKYKQKIEESARDLEL